MQFCNDFAIMEDKKGSTYITIDKFGMSKICNGCVFLRSVSRLYLFDKKNTLKTVICEILLQFKIAVLIYFKS